MSGFVGRVFGLPEHRSPASSQRVTRRKKIADLKAQPCPSPLPFSAAVNAAVNRGKMEIIDRDAARVALTVMLRTLAAYVQVASGGDLAKLVSSGFPTQKQTPVPVGTLPVPTNLVLRPGKQTGQLKARVKAVYGATGGYSWRLTTTAAPGVILKTVHSSASFYLFEGLTQGDSYNVEANAVGAAGASDWTNAQSLFVM